MKLNVTFTSETEKQKKTNSIDCILTLNCIYQFILYTSTGDACRFHSHNSRIPCLFSFLFESKYSIWLNENVQARAHVLQEEDW